MKSGTVVFQVYRTQNVPAWIARCMETARAWAALRGFDYEFFEDRLFDQLPPLFRGRTDNKVVLSDIARLLLTRDLLARGYERAVWVDADVVVFDPERWVLPTESNFYFSHELWPTPTPGGVRLDVRANNAVMVFSRDNHFLEFYIESCHRIAAGEANLKNWHLGVRFLTGIRNVCPLPLLENIGMFGAPILEDFVRGPKQLLRAYVRAMGKPLVAANLCASIAGTTAGDFVATEKVFEEVIEKCVGSKGEILNQYLK